MIIMRLSAGLGNQMFQYALGRRLSLDWGAPLKFDLSWFGHSRIGETPRDLEIDGFKVNLNKATVEEIKKAQGNGLLARLNQFAKKIRGRWNRNYFYRFNSRLLKKKKAVFLSGYFQSYKYFDSIRGILLADFVLREYSGEAQALAREIEQTPNAVAVHIRRGDYAASCLDWNGLCDVNYYQKGLAEVRKKYAPLKIFVFSDDIAWAKDSLKFDEPMVFVSRPSLRAAEELALMSLCKHQIIANSTFSWWAAWLNQNEKKIVVAPGRWLVAADIDAGDLLPSEWIKI
ncbi:alpha-1,2-fucosyltransferase [Patescibacteria group bacterium]|nr:MAG: alpha-1,2-fucosyltransferase [Patescibacteria group bacterium]